MVIRLPKINFRTGESQAVLLMSDLHIGASNCDKALIRSELDWAKENNAIALIAGDVFDLILPKDPRFVPNVLDKALANSSAILNGAIDMAADLLGPYADQLHVIGCGNHETSAAKHLSTDIISLLIERLQLQASEGHTIHHGGYTGAVVIPFGRDAGGSRSYKIWYHHGMGGAAPVTKGMIDFNRVSTYISGVDCRWMGHKHNRLVNQVTELSVPTFGPELVARPVWHIMTGAYTSSVGDSQFDPGGHYRTDWAREKGFAPQGVGGCKLWLTPTTRGPAIVDAEVVLT